MRRRIQAVPSPRPPCDCGPIGARLSRNGRPGPAVGAADSGDTGEGGAYVLEAFILGAVSSGYPADSYGVLLTPYPRSVASGDPENVSWSMTYDYFGIIGSPPVFAASRQNFKNVVVYDPGGTGLITVTAVYEGNSYTVEISA